MAIDPVGNAPISSARLMSRQRPGDDFFSSFEAAYAAYEGVSSAVSGAGPATKSDTLLADLMGASHMALSARRGIDAGDQAVYAGILARAYAGGGMDDPAGFLQSLNREELAVVQHMHCLADPIDPAGLSREGAYNLLLPEGYAVDFDHNGIQEVGLAKSIAFPPLDAPQGFKDAWFAATEGMDEGEVMSYGLMMHNMLYSIPVGGGDPVPIAASDRLASYRDGVAAYLKSIESFRSQLAEGQYERDLAFFSRLQRILG